MPSVPSDESAIETIRSRRGSLKQAEGRVAEAILADPTGVIELSVSELSARAGVSVASVVRCCQSLGFTGYHDLKLALARSSSPTRAQILGDVTPEDDSATVLDKVLGAGALALTEAIPVVDPVTFTSAADAIASARRVLVSGVGTSAPVASDAAYRFATLGIDVVAPADAHVQHVTARLMGPEDACLVVSHTGSTSETLAVARAAAAAGTTTIALTSFRQSPLTEVVSHALVAGSRETAFRIEAMASRLVHVALVDALSVALALRLGAAAAEALDETALALGEHRL